MRFNTIEGISNRRGKQPYDAYTFSIPVTSSPITADLDSLYTLVYHQPFDNDFALDVIDNTIYLYIAIDPNNSIDIDLLYTFLKIQCNANYIGESLMMASNLKLDML